MTSNTLCMDIALYNYEILLCIIMRSLRLLQIIETGEVFFSKDFQLPTSNFQLPTFFFQKTTTHSVSLFVCFCEDCYFHHLSLLLSWLSFFQRALYFVFLFIIVRYPLLYKNVIKFEIIYSHTHNHILTSHVHILTSHIHILTSHIQILTSFRRQIHVLNSCTKFLLPPRNNLLFPLHLAMH